MLGRKNDVMWVVEELTFIIKMDINVGIRNSPRTILTLNLRYISSDFLLNLITEYTF